jgi:acetylornithine deacetylase
VIGVDAAAARRTLERLVAFDTTSRNSNLALIDWAEARLQAIGARCVRVDSDDHAKTNLIAIIGPDAPGGVVLSGHTDVVPIDGQDWSSDPWVVTERNERLYGRGVADMKSFVALSMEAADLAVQAHLARPLILALSYDEEVGCLGAPRMIEAMLAAFPKPAVAIVGEPTEWRVVSGHKGIATFEVEIIGQEAHSSQVGQGASAIMAAIPLLSLIHDMAAEAASGEATDSPFSPPYPTMTVGLIDGGTAVNILARRCRFSWDLRCPPDVDADLYLSRFLARATEIDKALKRVDPSAGCTVRRRSSTPALAIDRSSAAETLVRAITGDNGISAAAYAAEAGLFQRAGIPVVVCGPGSIAQAHQPDEWIALDQIERGAAFMNGVLTALR